MTRAELKYYSALSQKKFRDLENKFLIEGEHIISECLRSEFYNSNIEKVFIREDYGNESMLEQIQKSRNRIEIISIPESSFNKLSETVNSQGIIGVVSKLKKDSGNRMHQGNIIVALDSVNDPGNLGTIIRTCYWFGIKNVITGQGSVEIFNSKVVRASQGAIFNVNICEDSDMKIELEKYFEKGYDIILSDLNSENYLNEFNIGKDKNYVIVFGNEAKGISTGILENINYIRLKIKGYSDCESLNLSVSAGIILYSMSNEQ